MDDVFGKFIHEGNDGRLMYGDRGVHFGNSFLSDNWGIHCMFNVKNCR